VTYSDRTSSFSAPALVFTLAALLAVPASAASFGIKPNAATIDANTPVAEFSLSSLSARATVFEVRVSRWVQTPEDDSYVPAAMMIVPAVFALSPYETRLIRIEPRGGPVQGNVEQSFRITITEVVQGEPSPPPAARRFDAVLFVPPRTPSGEPAFAISVTGKHAVLTVTNASNHHVFLGQPRIESGGKEIYRGAGLGYVLAGSTRTFSLTLTGSLESSGAELRFDDERASQQAAVLRVSR
jgi:P pilus assembly chaperone PapD